MIEGRKEGRKDRRKERGWVEGRKEGYKCGVIDVLQTHKLRLIGTFSPFYWTIELSTGYPQAVKNSCKIYHYLYYDILCNHIVTNTPGLVTDCNFCFHSVTAVAIPTNNRLTKPYTFPYLPHFSSYTSSPSSNSFLPTFLHLFYPLISSSLSLLPNFLKNS